MALAKLRIEPKGKGPILCNIYLDDFDIGPYICGFKITRSQGKPNMVELKLKARLEVEDLPVVMQPYQRILNLAECVDWNEVSDLKKIPAGLKELFAELHNIRNNSEEGF